jgi:hypothetical protein
MSQGWVRRALAMFPVVALAGCAGNGDGLNAQGEPIGAGGASAPLTADFESIQDNIFTPICTKCHIGAGAPEGLQLDAAHSYALLVGVPSAEVPSLLRVDPGAPDSSYIILKLQGSPGIVGAQMPFGGPYLDTATIAVIRQWITNGAPAGAAMARAAGERFAVSVTSPAYGAALATPAAPLVIAFNHELDASLVNYTNLHLQRVLADGTLSSDLPVALQLARGNAQAVLVTPSRALAPGGYRLTVRSAGGGALADLAATTLDEDYTLELSVGSGR